LVLTVGLAVEDELVGGRLETVDGGLGQQGIDHLPDPLDGLEVQGDQRGSVPVALDDQLVDIRGVERIERLEGEVVDLLRYRSKSIYPDPAIIPT
jgi:hypothetical protein